MPIEQRIEKDPYAPGGGSRALVREKALKKGLIVVEQLDVLGKIITCDFDNTLNLPEQVTKTERRLQFSLYATELEGYHNTTSVSGCGRHLYLVLKTARPLAVRVALAAALGSDPVREAINSHRLTRADEEMPVACFEKADVIPGLVDFLKAHALPGEYKVHLPNELDLL